MMPEDRGEVQPTLLGGNHIALIHTHAHTRVRTDWSYRSLFFSFVFFYICLFVVYHLFVRYLLMLYLYFDKMHF